MNHKLPPQNIEAEQSVLGSLLLEAEAWDEVADKLTADDFYKPSHRKIYDVIKELNAKGQPCDIVTVSNLLRKKNELDLVGGPTYIAEVLELTPSTANLSSHTKIVYEKSLLRRLISANQKIIEQSFQEDFEDINSFLDRVESDIFAIAEKKEVSGLIEASDLIKSSLKKLEELYERKAKVIGVPSGFVDLDNMTAGFQPGELTILAARPSMGKTALSLNIALNAALRNDKKVAYFSVEMAKEQVMIRMLANEAKIRLGDLRIGQIEDRSWPQLIDTAATLSEAPIFIDDSAGISPFEIRAKARRMKAKHGLDLIMVDYLQLMSLKQKVESREREVSEISKLLKAVAKELMVPVIALAQLNRGVEARSDRRPMLSDLRESGSIEQDADIIMMIYREDYYERDDPGVKGLAEVIIGKQRNGPTGTVKLRWQPEYGLFTEDIESKAGPQPPTPSGPPPSFNTSNRSSSQPSGKPKNFAPGAAPSI